MTADNLLPARQAPETMELGSLRRESDGSLTHHDFLDIYPQYDNDKKRAQARLVCLKEDKSLEETARIVGVPYSTVQAWAFVDKWLEQKQMELSVLQKEERIAMAKTRLKNRARIVNDQIEISTKIRKKAIEGIDEADTAGQLKMYSEAAKLAADVETRALGIAEDGKMGGLAEEGGSEEGGKQPLVMVFQGNSGLPPIRIAGRGEVIEHSPTTHL